MFFFPDIYNEVDWSVEPVFLDKELERFFGIRGARFVDKLVKVKLKNGQEKFLFIHIEVQSQRDPSFERREFFYIINLLSQYEDNLVSLVILADNSPNWRPTQYQYKQFGLTVRAEWPVAKLCDHLPNMDELLNHPNEFAWVVWAHLKSLETKGSQQERVQAKSKLYKTLLGKGLKKPIVVKLLSFIDWVLFLPNLENKKAWAIVAKKVGRKQMEVMPSFIRYELEAALEEGIQIGKEDGFQIGKEDGFQIGKEDGFRLGKEDGLRLGKEDGFRLGKEDGIRIGAANLLLDLLKLKFGEVPSWVHHRLAEANSKTLTHWAFAATTAQSLEEIFTDS